RAEGIARAEAGERDRHSPAFEHIRLQGGSSSRSGGSTGRARSRASSVRRERYADVARSAALLPASAGSAVKRVTPFGAPPLLSRLAGRRRWCDEGTLRSML